MRKILQLISSALAVGYCTLMLAPVATAEPLPSQGVRIVARTDTAPHRHYHRVRHVRRIRHVHNGHVYYTTRVYYTRGYYR